MENPFRSEAAAFRFLLATIGAFALIVIGSWIDTWLGLAVAVVLSAAAAWLYIRQRGERPPPGLSPQKNRTYVASSRS